MLSERVAGQNSKQMPGIRISHHLLKASVMVHAGTFLRMITILLLSILKAF